MTTSDEPMSKGSYVIYGTVMFFILCLGMAGNLLTIPVLLHRDHRRKSITPLMLNVCIVDIILCTVGYSVAVSYNLAGKEMNREDNLRCGWLAFINCFTGIVAIITLSVMSFISYLGITQVSTAESSRIPKKTMMLIIGSIWLFSFAISVPPAFGWSSFVPFENGISCHPDWVSQDSANQAYIALLVTGGFFLPLITLVYCYSKTYRYIKGNTFPVSGSNEAVFIRQMETQKRMIRMTVVAVILFFISWSPYCIVSLMATAYGRPILKGGISLIPELMAKASVVYNPLVYTFMNTKFRVTLKNVLRLNYNAVNPTSTDEICDASVTDVGPQTESGVVKVDKFAR
uniref:Opsin n=1 Tax=Actinia equina TaxID=6106 RepID=A0A346FTZ0_ACTEQ|nr:opsin [Actinia equina]